MASELLEAAEELMSEVGDMKYRRPLSDAERRIDEDFDRCEEAVAVAAGPIVKKMLAQLVDEANGYVAARDFAGIAALSASYVAELASALDKAGAEAVDLGRAQVTTPLVDPISAAEADTAPHRKRASEAGAVALQLSGVARLRAQTIADRLTLAVRNTAQRRARLREGGFSEQDIGELTDSAIAYVVTESVMFGREAMTLGRMIELAALVALATTPAPETAPETAPE